MKSVFIIGNGPAGCSAAIHLKRLNHEVTIISKSHQTLTSHDLVENYYGFESPIPGPKLIELGIKQAKSIGVNFIDDTVIDIKPRNDQSYQITATSKHYDADIIILATGKKRNVLNIPGFMEFRGKGVHLCAACDGFFYRNKKVAMIGYGAYLESELEVLKATTNDIIIFSQNYESDEFPVIKDDVISLSGDTRIREIKTKHHVYEISGVFVALGFPSALEFATKLGIITEKNNITVNSKYQTNLENIYAIGDAIGGKLQITKAVYDGMMLADIIHQSLK